MLTNIVFSFLILISQFTYSIQYNDIFNEELFIKPLPTGQINTYFQFTTKWYRDETANLLHTHLISRPLAELFLHYKIKELHISLTHGLWRYETWGYPTIEASPGAEIWAWFDDNNPNITDDIIDVQWNNLCSTLSGLLCASLSFIDTTNTLKPKYSFRPQFNIKNDINTTFVRYGTLSHEIVCKENLTPWKKLLPCSVSEGFISLLNSDQLYSTNYHSMGIHVRSLINQNNIKESILEIKQTVNVVFDPHIIGSHDWSIRKLFGQGLNGMCTLSNSSKIYIDITNKNYELIPQPTNIFLSKRGGNELLIAEYDIEKLAPNKMFNLAIVNKENTNNVPLISPPPLYARRYILGIGQERGKIVTKINNMHWTSLNIILQENIPWFVPIYLHTLTLKIGNNEIKPVKIKYIPGQQRLRPYHLEVAFTVPARSSIEVSIDFDYIFLKWLEYPPDANHGHYIGSAVITALLPIARNYTSVPIDGSLFRDSFNASRNGYLIQIRTENLLLTLPTPDFSMPYNVICLACTVVALAFGPIHNMSTKRLVIQTDDVPQTLFGKLKQKLFKKKIILKEKIEKKE